jgi:hypothetical protein
MPVLRKTVTRAFAGDAEPVELAAEADRKFADVDHLLDFALRLAGDLARLPRDQRRELHLVLTQHLTQPAHEATALRRGHGAPGVEGLLGGDKHLLGVGGGSRGEGAQLAPVHGGACDELGAGAEVRAAPDTHRRDWQRDAEALERALDGGHETLPENSGTLLAAMPLALGFTE